MSIRYTEVAEDGEVLFTLVKLGTTKQTCFGKFTLIGRAKFIIFDSPEEYD